MNKQIKNIQITNTQKETEKTEIKDDIKESIKKENNEDMMEVKERLDKIEGLVSGFSNEINTIKAEMIVITNKINALKNNLFSLLESNLPLLEEIDEMKKAISELQDFHERAN
jgi:chromosome segregation ATPase